MVRRADELFLTIAVKKDVLEKGIARSVLDELKAFEARGEPRKARHVCLERGLMSDKIAKKVKVLVMEALAAEKQNGASKPSSKKRKRIGNYALTSVLTQGEDGSLHKAQTKDGAEVLVRVLTEKAVPDGPARKAYMRTVQAAMELRDPSLVPILEVGEDKGAVYVVMADVQGRSLVERVAAGERLDEKEATRLALAAKEVLTEAERRGVLHGNLSPEKVIYDAAGARIMELGVRPPGLMTRSIEEGAALAPEALAGRDTDLRADIYSLGVTLYYGTSGTWPYTSIDAIRYDPTPPLLDRAPGLTPGFCQLVEAMLNREPDQRYRSYEALGSDIDNVMAGFAPALELGAFTSKVTAGGGLAQPSAGGRGIKAGKSAKSGKARARRASRNAGAPELAFDGAESDAEGGRTRSRRRRGGGEIEQTSSVLPLAALGLAAVAFIGAVFIFGGGSGEEGPPTTGPIVVDSGNPDRDRNLSREAAEKAATDEYESLRGARGWDRLKALERIASDYPNTERAQVCQREAKPLRERLEREEKSYVEKERLAVLGLRENGEVLAAIEKLRGIRKRVQGASNQDDVDKEIKALEAERTQLLSAANSESQRLARVKRFGEAAQVLKDSLGLREPNDKQTITARIAELEGQQKSLDDSEQERLLKGLEAEVLALEDLVVNEGPAGRFEKIHITAQDLLKKVRNTPYFARVTVHAEACPILAQLDNLVSAAALDLIGQRLELFAEGGARYEGQLVEVERDGGLVLKIQGGDLTVPRETLSLESKEDILKTVKTSPGRGYLALGLRFIYAGQLKEGFKRLDKAQAAGDSAANSFVASKRVYIKLWEGKRPSGEPDPGGEPDPADPKDPDKPEDEPVTPDEPKEPAMDASVLARLIYDRSRDLFQTATEVGCAADGRTDGLYVFYSGAKRLSPADWNVKGRSIYPSTDRRSLVLEKSGSIFHKAVHSSEIVLRVRLSYEGGLMRNSNISLVIIDEKKREEYHSLFGQQLYQYKRGRKANFDGLARINYDLFKPKTEYQLEIGYKDGEVYTKVEGEQNARFTGLGISEATVGIVWSNVSVDLRQCRVQGYLEEQWVKKRLEEVDEAGKR